MRKIDVRSYKVTVALPDGTKSEDDYITKDSLCICLLHPALQLTGMELLNRVKIKDKIESAGEYVLLEEDEYAKLKTAFETIQGFSANDVEMVRRVLEAEEIQVEEKPKI